ncbi:MAG: hypothetical protein Q4G51_10175 [Dermatophilus congolensis]|nr:hypothetical protein [Dermatophilus congolensis]
MADHHGRDRTNGLIPMKPRAANGIMALVPVLAILAFFASGSWLWFLAIPVVGVVVYGTGGRERG